MRTLIVGLGNPVLGDDGVGWRVAELVRQKLQDKDLDREQVDVICLAVGGLSLMEHLVDYERAILVDALDTGQGSLGSVSQFDYEDLPNPGSGHTSSTHDTSLKTALEMGRSIGLKLPEKITIIAVDVHVDYNFTENLTPSVAVAVPIAAQKVIETLDNLHT
jgi:hydrogenase maturation protease